MHNLRALIKSLFWKVFIRARWLFHSPRKEGAEIGDRVPDFMLSDLTGRSFTLFENFPTKGTQSSRLVMRIDSYLSVT